MVKRPVLRSSSATSRRATSHATRKPMEYRKPSYPLIAIAPQMPRNDAADR